jgi:hypothetical protein
MSEQMHLGVSGEAMLNPESSMYMRTSWMLDSHQTMGITGVPARIRFLDSREAAQLQEAARKRNVFARHSWENNFYLQRIQEFADRTVIEVVLPGDPDSIAEEAQAIADVVESVAVLSTVLFASRATLQNRLGITRHRKDVVDFTIGPKFQYLRSSSKRERRSQGVTVDGRFSRRFRRLNLDVLVKRASQIGEVGGRLRQSLEWLLQSRVEPSLPSALVKTAISLESLLGRSETEPLSRTLSERAAFLMSQSPDLRESLSGVVRRFYDSRSRVVHGSSKRGQGPSSRLLESVDRLTFLLAVTIAANADAFGSFEVLRRWVEEQRWGKKDVIVRPFRDGDLKRALSRAAKE